MGDSNAAALKGWVQRTIAEMLLMEVGWCTYMYKCILAQTRAHVPSRGIIHSCDIQSLHAWHIHSLWCR